MLRITEQQYYFERGFYFKSILSLFALTTSFQTLQSTSAKTLAYVTLGLRQFTFLNV